MKKYKVGVIGATGMVGQRFLLLLANHPWFEVKCLAASASSAGKTYKNALKRWHMKEAMPEKYADMVVLDATCDKEKIAAQVDFCFCAVNMKKEEIRELEYAYAKLEFQTIRRTALRTTCPWLFRKSTPTTCRLLRRRENALARSAALLRLKATARFNLTFHFYTL